MHPTAIPLALLVGIAAIPAAAAPKAKNEAPVAAAPLAMKVTTEEGYRIEEGFFRVKIKDRLVLLQGLIVKKSDSMGKLPIMLATHGTTGTPKQRHDMTPRGVKDSNVRMLRSYARRGWLSIYVLRRGYGQSDGPTPVANVKCDGTPPTLQDFMDADADDLEATLAYIGQREDADTSRAMALGVSGGGAAVVALGARNPPGLKVIVNISGGVHLFACNVKQNSERMVEVMRHYGTQSKVPNLWYYAEADRLFPGQTVADMRAAFLEGGGYAKLVDFPTLTDFKTNEVVDGHRLWWTLESTIMVDVDGYLRSNNLPTWDFNEAKLLATRIGIKNGTQLPSILEFYLASPGYKALAQSTTSETSLVDAYNSATLEAAEQGAIAACQKRYAGHTCKIVDPPPEPKEISQAIRSERAGQK